MGWTGARAPNGAQEQIPTPDQFQSLVENAGHAVTFLENLLLRWGANETCALDMERLIPEAIGLLRMVLRVTAESHDQVVAGLQSNVDALQVEATSTAQLLNESRRHVEHLERECECKDDIIEKLSKALDPILDELSHENLFMPLDYPHCGTGASCAPTSIRPIRRQIPLEGVGESVKALLEHRKSLMQNIMEQTLMRPLAPIIIDSGEVTELKAKVAALQREIDELSPGKAVARKLEETPL